VKKQSLDQVPAFQNDFRLFSSAFQQDDVSFTKHPFQLAALVLSAFLFFCLTTPQQANAEASIHKRRQSPVVALLCINEV